MKIIDIIYLISVTILVFAFVFFPKLTKGFSISFIIFIIVLAILQLLTSGFYWHYFFSYLLLGVLSFIACCSWSANSRLKRRLIRVSLLVLLIAAIVPWWVLTPVPEMIGPTGKYLVGTRIFRWVDMARDEQITTRKDDKRNVVVQAWYPAQEGSQGTHSEYIDGLGELPAQIGPLPSWVFDHYEQVNTYGLMNVAVSKTKKKWPVILFLTGNGASRAFYTSLVSGLASHGYIVLAIDHPYEAMIAKLADGKITTTIEAHSSEQSSLVGLMEERLITRIADVEFVLDQLQSPLASPKDFFYSLDHNSIFITGHSLGGASAAVAMAADPRIKAAANIDGTLYGQLPRPNGTHPFLLIESSKDGDRFQSYQNGNKKLFKQFNGGFRFQIPEADHYSFTDAPFMLGLPARYVMGKFQSFGQIPEQTHYATIGILDLFFSGVQKNDLSSMQSVVSRYPWVVRKPVNY